MGLYENIKKACSERGISINKLETELRLPRSSVSKYNKNSPSIDKVQKIADFLEFPLEYLTTGEKEDSPVYYTNEETAKLAQEMFEDEDMRSLFHMKRTMPPDRFKAHMEFMKNLYNQEKGGDF